MIQFDITNNKKVVIVKINNQEIINEQIRKCSTLEDLLRLINNESDIHSAFICYDSIFELADISNNLSLVAKIIVNNKDISNKTVKDIWSNREMSIYGGELTYYKIKGCGMK